MGLLNFCYAICKMKAIIERCTVNIAQNYCSYLIYFSHDFLEIYDGNKVVKKLSGVLLPATIQSSTPNVTIKFHSDELGVTTGFAIEIKHIILRKL